MKEKNSRNIELKELLDKDRALRDQETRHNKEIFEQQVEAERITKLIQPVQQRIQEFTHALASTSSEHPSSSIVQELEQQEKEAYQEIERITPILVQFQQTIGNASQLQEKT